MIICLPHFISGFFVDLGKVLAGIQAPEEDSAQFGAFLSDLGYPYVEETYNEIYKRYLRK
jgi:threonine dehydratase